MENVPQVLTAPQWPDLVGRLAAMGYRSKWAKLDSSDFGSAQKRVRAFMVSRLDAEPPDLPKCVPNAPRLCLRDVMEPTREGRFVRRIPLDRVKWREPQSDAKKSDDRPLEVVGEDMSEGQWKPHRYIIAPESPCRNVGAYVNAAQRGIKVVAGSSTPTAEDTGESFYSRAMLYASSSSSPTIRTFHSLKDQIKVVADMKGGGLDIQRRLYSSSSSSSPALLRHDGGGREVKVVAEDTAKAYGSSAKVLSSSSSSPTLRSQAHGLQNQPKVMKGSDGGDLVVNVLTPLECWRLMGQPYWAYRRASAVCSETQLYNQAGNSIVVEVLMAIFSQMFGTRAPRRVQASLAQWGAPA